MPPHGLNGHASSGAQRGEIERQIRHAVLKELHGDRGFALDLIGRIREAQPEYVVKDVDARLTWVSVGGKDGRDQEACEHETESHGRNYRFFVTA